MKLKYIILPLVLLSTHASGKESTGNDLSYENYIDSHKPIKCLYGYVAEKTGDHESAIKIFEDCIKRWDSVYSMIWLAQIYESGIGVPKNLPYATALMKRGAQTNDTAGYSSLAKFHYGVALVEGKGTKENKEEGIKWLKESFSEGIAEAGDYLSQKGLK